jgi:hypothetical protein
MEKENHLGERVGLGERNYQEVTGNYIVRSFKICAFTIFIGAVKSTSMRWAAM